MLALPCHSFGYLQELSYNVCPGQAAGDRLVGGSVELLDNPTTSVATERGAPWSRDLLGPDGQVNSTGDWC